MWWRGSRKRTRTARRPRPARTSRARDFSPAAAGKAAPVFRLLDAPPAFINPRPAATRGRGAQVAQLVEHVTENHGVGGSIPPLGTNAPFSAVLFRPRASAEAP